MTIPTRPAPSPPGPHTHSAAAGANESLAQLRLQFEQEQQLKQQQQHHERKGGRREITLPPPPNRSTGFGQQAQRNLNNINIKSSITRKFPQARYKVSTNWESSLFETASKTIPNGNIKKIAPPRPPPPTVQKDVRIALAPSPPVQSSNILANLFTPKGGLQPPARSSSGTRIYGVSSGKYSSSSLSTSEPPNNDLNWTTDYAVPSHSASKSITCSYTNSISNTMKSQSYLQTSPTLELQLISFDTPPSSPTLTQKSNSDCVSVDSFSSDSNFSSPNNGSGSQPESGFEDDFSAGQTSLPISPWVTNTYAFNGHNDTATSSFTTAPVRNLNTTNRRTHNILDNPLCNGKSLLPPPPSHIVPTIIKPKLSLKPKAPKPPLIGGGSMQLHGNADKGFESNLYPLKTQEPPATVSLIDVISGKVDAVHLGVTAACDVVKPGEPHGIALYAFEGVEQGDLCFKENEKIYLLEQVTTEWYRGRTRAGCEGIFPINYIEIKVPLSKPSHDRKGRSKPLVRSLYNFNAEVTGDLLLKENDMVTVLYKINDDWLFGEIEGRQGHFPANFLEYVPTDLPLS